METHRYIEEMLAAHQNSLQADFDKYRNHACRIFYLCCLQDKNPDHTDTYDIAAAFHDLGIWTNKTFDYLNPSIQLAADWLTASGQPDRIKEISLMIDMHHKISRYKGDYAETVNTFRKADWADVSLGLIRFKIPRREIRKIKKEFPFKGFHRFLLKMTLKNMLKHPLNPLPMFKK